MSLKIFLKKSKKNAPYKIMVRKNKIQKIGFYKKDRDERYVFLDFLEAKRLLVNGAKPTKKLKKIFQEIDLLPK